MDKNNNYKVTFRPLLAEDMEMRTRWLQNPLVSKNLGWQNRKGTTLDEQVAWFNRYKNDNNDQRFIIEVDTVPVGIVGLTDINPVDMNAMLYIIIGEDNYRGLGIGKRSCEYIINYGFSKLGLHKIFLEVNSFNEPAINLYHSLGFKEEGRLKEKLLVAGDYFDEIYMGLTPMVS